VPDAVAEGRCRRRLTRTTLRVFSSLNKLERTSSEVLSVELWSFCPEAIAEGNGGGAQRGLLLKYFIEYTSKEYLKK